MLKDWASHTYVNATEYWTFRKKLTQQIALAGFVEFVLHLTRLGPEMINIAKDSGNITFNNFRFDIDDAKGLKKMFLSPTNLLLPTNFLSVFDHFVGLARKGLKVEFIRRQQESSFNPFLTNFAIFYPLKTLENQRKFHGNIGQKWINKN